MQEETPDLSEFYDLSRRKTCKVGGALEALKPAEKKKLEAALAVDSGRIPHAVIVRWIKDHAPNLGALVPSTESVSRHRKGQCTCV